MYKKVKVGEEAQPYGSQGAGTVCYIPFAVIPIEAPRLRHYDDVEADAMRSSQEVAGDGWRPYDDAVHGHQCNRPVNETVRRVCAVRGFLAASSPASVNRPLATRVYAKKKHTRMADGIDKQRMRSQQEFGEEGL